MPSTYIPHHLVHAHLPPPPSIPNAIPELRIISDQAVPLTDEDYAEPLHPDHAVSAIHDSSTNILARSIYNGHVLELRSFNPVISKVRPRGLDGSETIRIFFPEQLRSLAQGSIQVSKRDKRLFVLVVSHSNIVYRLNFPLGTFRSGTEDRFVFTTKGNDEWYEEWEVPEDVIGACSGVSAWTALDENTLVLGGGDGGIARVTRSGYWSADSGRWTATHHRASSRLRLPSLFSRSANTDEQIISFAQFQHHDHIPLLYTLSRDRKLRTWNASTGAGLRTADVRSSSQELVVRGSQEGSSSSIIEDGSVNMIQVVPHPSSASQYSHLVIAFASTPHSSSSAGTFVVYRASTSSHSVSDLSPAGDKACSPSSAGAELRGFEILPAVKSEGIDSGWKLWVTWDKKGSTFCETITMDDIFQFTTYIETNDALLLSEWQQVTAPDDVETFDAAYFDNILSSDPPNPADPEDNGDIPAAFIQHLFHPGRFSILTLTTALEDYIHQLSRKNQAQQIATSFASLSKRFGGVVGSQIEMEFSPQTGAPVVDAYRKKLKLDWLGVWSNVRDVDKQARWPISSTVIQKELLVLTREGVSTAIPTDVAGLVDRLGKSEIDPNHFLQLSEGSVRRLYPALAPPKARASAIAISMAGSFISNILMTQDATENTGTALDDFVNTTAERLATVTHEPPEVIAGSVWDDHVEELLAEEDRTSVRRILSESASVSRALDESLNILQQASFPLASSSLEELNWSGSGKALLTSNIAQFIESRFSLARNVLLVTFFHLFESRDPSYEDDEGEELIAILARALVIFHRYRVLKWVCDQTGEEGRERSKTKRTNKRKVNGGDDVLAEGFGSLRMKEGEDDQGLDSDTYDIGYSLVHSLLARQIPQPVTSGLINRFVEAASTFVSGINLVDPEQTDVGAQKADLQLSYRILVDGHAQLAGAFTDMYPLSAGISYVKGRAYLECGMIEEAVKFLEKAAAGCNDGSLSPILPSTTGSNGLSEYYRHICRVFDDQGADEPVVYFGQLAIQSNKGEVASTKDLWTKVFLASIALGRYEDAYSTLTGLPFMDLKRDFLGQLISVMCENNEVGRLNSLGFIGFQKDVEEMLRFKARNSDPLRFPNYYKVLYSWHIARGDYRSAGEIMYLQGRRFAEGSNSKIPAFELSAMQARSYLAAINALTLVERRNAWVSVPGVPSKALRGIKRRKVSNFIPEEEFTKEKRPVDIISLADIEMEYTLVLSQLRLSSHIPDLHEHGVTVSPQEVVGLFIQRGMFDIAQSAASSLQVDMTDLFQALAARCVELSRLSEHNGDFSAATFLQSSAITARLRGSPSALSIKYLQTALSRHDSPKTNWKYRQAVADTLFEMNKDKKKGWQMPVWLAQWEMDRDPEAWIGKALKYGWVEEALGWTIDLVRKATPPELLPKGKSNTTKLPYNLIDRVLAASQEGDEKDEQNVQQKAKVLREEIQRRLKGLEKI
ncbi:hypothetical protein I302_106585 [Kwoniella bestiolae CBS 10118]|uniref:Nuclear pore complex protein Nup160 n=1 Tax=Kwoniella bestiolae CBS 10118 TaxID=1296100 RepID=A0A1B9G0Z3_9TREE|nr:nuclear pore complex protein Nup160 [Kwoniella bestiolae CBS 10118]OCF24692.1 nuclear pore complex protein Nup160 [Kwoniella bestiolae CBS 10118]